MSLGTYPIVFWGTKDDLTTYTQTGTCTVTGSVLDPWGGTTGQKLTNTGAVAGTARYVEYTAAKTGYHVATVLCAPVANPQLTAIRFANQTLGGGGLTSELSWAGNVPTLTTPNDGVMTPVMTGGNATFAVQRVWAWAVAGHTMRLTLYPSGLTAATSDAAYFTVMNCTLLDIMDSVTHWEEPREGSSWAQGGSGAEDAWIQGTDYLLSGTVQWVPQQDRSNPAGVSGWGNPLERVGVNCGVSAMLRAGRNKEALTFYTDRSDISSYLATTCYLMDPLRGAPAVQPNGDRSFTLTLRNASTPFRAGDLV